jgi:pyruvate dehydrogenase E1 component alpha subunit
MPIRGVNFLLIWIEVQDQEEIDMSKEKKTALTKEQLVDFYKTMITIRRFEEAAIENFHKGIVLGNMHASNGQEAVAVGVIKALDKDDMVSSHHRCNGHFIAKGADMGKMMAEMMGKEQGLCKGRGGKMHQTDIEHKVMCGSGIVGASLLLGPGHALYSQLNNPGQVTVAIFGDGAANQGMFHEGINLAALWKLPVVFVCENNQFAISTRMSESSASATISQRSVGYDIPGVTVDGNDVIAVYEVMVEAVARARAGKGPSLIECVTYRVQGHYEGDDMSYRTKEETRDWAEKHDPIKKLKEELVSGFGWTDKDDKAIWDGVETAVQKAVEFGVAGTPMSVKDIELNVFAGESV